MKKIKGYLTDTVLNMEHPRAITMQEDITAAVKEHGGELRKMEIMEAGIAVIDISSKEVESKIASELGKLDGIEVTDISSFEMQLERNRNLQKKINSSRAKKAAKKAQSQPS